MTATPPLKIAAAGQRGIRNRELHRGAHARQRANRVEVVALDVAAIDGTRLHGRPFHAGHADVDRVHRLTGHLQRHVEIFLLGAHQGPLVRRLDGDRLRMRMRRLGGTMGDLAVGRGAAARRVRDDAVPGAQLGHRHVPERRRGQQQPLARLGSRQLQVIPAVLDRGRGVRPHAAIETVGDARHARAVAIPERRLAAALRIGGAVAHHVEGPLGRLLACVAVRRRVLRPHLRPVALQLLADHHGVGGPDALTELGLRDADRHGVIRRDDDPGIDFRRRRILVPDGAGHGLHVRLLRVRLLRHPEAEHEGSLGCGDRREKLAAIDARSGA